MQTLPTKIGQDGFMITSILAALTMMPITRPHEVVDLNPIDDAWVYPHAGDPQTDEYLRVWGQSEGAVPADMGDRDNYSFAYLRFDIERCPTDKKLEAAELVLTHIPNPSFKVEDTKNAPLEVRPVIGTFTEKTWNYDLGAKVVPGPKKQDIFGTGSAKEISEGLPFEISVDLMKGPNSFGVYLSKALAEKDKTLCLALTSSLDPSVLGRTGIYKFYSKDHKENPKRRPMLRLTFDNDVVLIPLSARLLK